VLSSAGRASPLQGEGRGFEPLSTHQPTDEIAKVNGVIITQSALMSKYQQLQDQQRQFLTQNKEISIDPEAYLDALSNQLKTVALEQLIMSEVLVQGALSNNFYVSEEQAESSLLTWPIFQEDGAFSPQRLAQFLSYMSSTQSQFLQQLKNQLLIEQISFGLKESSFVLPKEIDAAIKIHQQSRDFSYVIIPVSLSKESTNLDEKQLQEYYNTHQEDFKIPEQIRLDYVQLSMDDLAKQQKESGSTKTPEQLFAEASDKLASLSYENPNSIDTVSQTLKLPIQTTDYFSQTDAKKGIASNPAVLKAAFSAEVLHEGYNSDVITIDGQSQVVVRLKDRIPASYQPIEKVKDVIQAKLQNQLKQQATKKLGEQIQQRMLQGESVNVVTQQYSLTEEKFSSIAADDKTVDPTILNYVFSLPHPALNESSISGTQLPSGDFVIVITKKVNLGDPQKVSAEEKTAISQRLKKTIGDIDYHYYVNSLMNKADIER
jgi:hypothetical protein